MLKLCKYQKNNMCKKKYYFKNRNVIKFKSASNFLSDSDFEDLFMGLVRLITSTAKVNAEKLYKNKINMLELKLKYFCKHKC